MVRWGFPEQALPSATAGLPAFSRLGAPVQANQFMEVWNLHRPLTKQLRECLQLLENWVRLCWD